MSESVEPKQTKRHKKPKRKRGIVDRIITWALVLIIIGTLCTLGYYLYKDFSAQNSIQDNGKALQKEYSAKTYDEKNTKKEKVRYDTPLQNLTSDEILNGTTEANMRQLNGYVRGRIQAPSINMDLPLFNGVSHRKLLVGAGTLKPDQTLKGNKNFAVAGHNTHTWRPVLFAQVPKLQKGAKITVSFHNKVATYAVESITVVTPYQVDRIEDKEAKDAKKPLLSLITCTPDSKNRYLVRAVQTSLVEY